MAIIRESDLPGIGRKFQVETDNGDKLVVVIHDDGRRELYHFDANDPDESKSLVVLTDTEARQVAGIIGGLAYMPRALEQVELTLDDLVIEWCKVGPKSHVVGKQIGDLQIRQNTGATVVAMIEKNQRQVVNPGPTQEITPESTLVVAGERHQVIAFKQFLNRESG